uniref:Uncharacterized protein n=1 Tax=Moniliophthora roreri TaxID=221103 RepID=A0A0W0FKF7_MONRR
MKSYMICYTEIQNRSLLKPIENLTMAQ